MQVSLARIRSLHGGGVLARSQVLFESDSEAVGRIAKSENAEGERQGCHGKSQAAQD